MTAKNLQPDGDEERQRDDWYEDQSEMEKDSWLIRLIRFYMRIPFLRKINPVQLGMFLLILLVETVLLRLFLPPGWPLPVPNCTCAQQYSDPELQALAKAGNQDVKRYLSQVDNPLNCMGRRKELLDKLEKEKHKERRKR